MRRTKVSLIYRRTRNLRAVQLLLGHTKLESTVRYLGHRSRRRSGNRRADRGLITRVAGRRVRRRPAASGRKRPAARTSGVQGKSGSVSVDLGGRRIIKKKKNKKTQ